MNCEIYKVRVRPHQTIWYQNNEQHRIGGPAIENVDGYKAWFRHGKRHREDGPAIECPEGAKYWYLEGLLHSEEEFNEKMNPKPSCDGEIVEVKGRKYKLSLVPEE